MSKSVKNKSKKELHQILTELDKAYYLNKPNDNVLSDEYYDNVRDIYEQEFGQWDNINSVKENKKVKLPYWLGSLDKIMRRDENKLKNWLKKFSGPYVISDKLDGGSLLLCFKDGKMQALNRTGIDNTFLVNYINNIPINKVNNDTLVVRGELIMKGEVFKRKYASKYANSRNLVNGIANSKQFDINIVKDIDFVAYECIEPSGMNLSSQLNFLYDYGFECVGFEIINDISVDILEKLLEKFKSRNIYEIDGIVVNDNSTAWKRVKSGNPKNAFAFKTISETKNTIVSDVVWNISSYSVLIPVVWFEPVELDGVVIKKATGYNADYIISNKIGPGAEIEITRSGGVIPKILNVITPAPEIKLPEIKYEWDETKVNIISIDKSSNTNVLIKQIAKFFEKVEAKGISEKTIKRFVNSELNSISKIINASKEDFLKVERFGEKQAEKIYNSILKSITNIPISKLMAGTSYFGFGFGERKFDALLKKMPDFFELYYEIDTNSFIEIISEIEGFTKTSAEKIISGIENFLNFIKENPKITYTFPPEEEKEEKQSKYNSKNIVFSGFRAKDLENKIQRLGGNVKTSVSEKTDFVVVKNISDNSAKIQKAKELKIPILSREEFEKSLED